MLIRRKCHSFAEEECHWLADHAIIFQIHAISEPINVLRNYFFPQRQAFHNVILDTSINQISTPFNDQLMTIYCVGTWEQPMNWLAACI